MKMEGEKRRVVFSFIKGLPSAEIISSSFEMQFLSAGSNWATAQVLF